MKPSKVKKLFNRLFPKTLFPKEVIDFWLCGYAEDRKILMKYWFRKKYVDWSVGDITPLYRKNGYKAIYKITKIDRPYGDYAMYDDGRKYNLKLIKVERGLTYETT